MPVREPALKRFGSNVRAKREARDLSQEALAEKADLDRTSEGGERNPMGNDTTLKAA